MIVVGVAGTIGSGKGTVVEYLVGQYNFRHFSVRQFLIQKIKQKGMEVNRDSMFIVANELRAKHGSGYIAQELYIEAKKSGTNAIIESIRTPGEIDLLKKQGPFFLFAVDADPSIRYERIKSRASETDHVSYTEFLSNEEREMQSTDPNKQNLRACINLSDYIFHNNGTLDELHKQVDEVMKQIDK